MDKPLAFKEKEGLSPSFAVEGSLLTGVLCLTVYRCPNCRRIYRIVLGPGDVLLGEGERECPKCKKAFRDRSLEWPTLPTLDGFLFLFPGFVCGWILLALIIFALFSWLEWTLTITGVLMGAAIFFVTPLVAWFAFRSCQIARSVHRFNLHGKTKAA